MLTLNSHKKNSLFNAQIASFKIVGIVVIDIYLGTHYLTGFCILTQTCSYGCALTQVCVRNLAKIVDR